MLTLVTGWKSLTKKLTELLGQELKLTMLVLQHSDIVKIGTTTEGNANADNLTVADSANSGITIRSGTSNLGSIFFSDATSGGGEYAGFIDYNHSSNQMSFGTAENTRLTLKSNGNLGIGTVNPTVPLQINHISPKIILEDDDNGADVSITNIGGAAVYSSQSDVLFQTADTSERLRITSGGAVGIGTNNPALRAHIFSTANADAALIESTQNFATLRFKSATNTSGPTVGIDGGGGLQLDQKDTSKYIAFSIGSERLRILNDGKVRVPDGGKFVAGAGDDLQIYHDGNHSYIDDAGVGNLYIRGGDAVQLQKYTGENFVKCIADGTVQLYYDNSKKLETTNTGVDVTGEVQCDSLDVDGVVDITGEVTLHANLDLQDDDKIMLGTGDDLRLYHNATNSYIENYTGNLYIFNASDDKDIYLQSDDGSGNLILMFSVMEATAR